MLAVHDEGSGGAGTECCRAVALGFLVNEARACDASGLEEAFGGARGDEAKRSPCRCKCVKACRSSLSDSGSCHNVQVR